MPQYLNFHFDPELFLLNWKNTEDLTLTALYDSGAVQENAEIASLIANGGDFYTIPFYDVLGGGAPVNYDGATNITATEHSGTAQTGVVYGRAQAWKARQFIRDFNSGADPMQSIAAQVAKYWQKWRQNNLLKILDGVFGVTDDSTDKWDAWQLHTTNLATTGSSASAANRVTATTVGDAIQKAVGDNADVFSMAIMHSAVANAFAKLDLLEYRKYTDANGIQRPLRIADINGMTVIIDDGVPVKDSSSANGEKEYTTYLFGTGAIQHANAPVSMPYEEKRDALVNGGEDYLITRMRETLHPNGFSYVLPTSGYTHSPTDEQLSAAANWRLVGDPKGIAMARIITNG